MLVLSRKPGQSLIIGGQIVLTVLEIDGDRVKLGIEAPRQVPVLRHELFAETTRENLAASAAGTSADQLLQPLLSRR